MTDRERGAFLALETLDAHGVELLSVAVERLMKEKATKTDMMVALWFIVGTANDS